MKHENTGTYARWLRGMALIGCSLITTVVALTISSAAQASETTDPVKQLAGRFSEHFSNSDVDGDKFWSDNVVEIVPVSANAAYFRIHLEFYNGHLCDLSGVAQASGSGLRYQEPVQVYDVHRVGGMKNSQCVLQISKQDDHLLLQESDPDLGCKENYCGVRGGFDGVTLPWKSHRIITYMQKLKTSNEYRDALKQWHRQTDDEQKAPVP
ncbi:MAG: hypothetical protein ACYC0M_04025 [Burkholderiales bacterium]